jgi:hypothetical protein
MQKKMYFWLLRLKHDIKIVMHNKTKSISLLTALYSIAVGKLSFTIIKQHDTYTQNQVEDL